MTVVSILFTWGITVRKRFWIGQLFLVGLRGGGLEDNREGAICSRLRQSSNIPPSVRLLYPEVGWGWRTEIMALAASRANGTGLIRRAGYLPSACTLMRSPSQPLATERH